jgi:hypothetical protein
MFARFFYSLAIFAVSIRYFDCAPCLGGSPDIPGLPTCEMPENLAGSSWNEVSNANGQVISGAVCTAAVCGRNGEFRQINFPPSSTYIQTPYDHAYWGQYYTNGVWVRSDGCVMQPGASSPSFCPGNGNPTVRPTQKPSFRSQRPTAPTTQPTVANCDAHKTKIRNAIGLEAKNRAEAKSKGLCARYVRIAIEAAMKRNYPPHPVAACEQGPILEQLGFRNISTPSQNGDITVYSCVPAHKYGHIQVLYEGKWFSDFAQKSDMPWLVGKKGSVPTFYRYFGCY